MTQPEDHPEPPGRILMTTDSIGGVWSYSVELCRELGKHGVEVILATMGAPLRQGQRIEAAGVENVQLIEGRHRLEWMEAAERDIEAAGTWLELLEAQFAPEVIHLNGFAHASLPWSAPVIVVAHSDVLTWWEAVHGARAPASWDAYAQRVRQGLHSADIVVFPTQAMLDALQRVYGRLPSTRAIHNGRDTRRFAPREKEGFILSAGRLWDQAKNARALADIAPDLGWPVRMAGETVAPHGERAELRNVELLGTKAPGEMADLFARASIYALPARYEPFGLTALEAGLSGCALVLGDIPTLREIWDDAAEFVPPDDTAALRQTISRLITDPERRADFAGRALRRSAQFTAGRMALAYLAAYADAGRVPRFSESESASSNA